MRTGKKNWPLGAQSIREFLSSISTKVEGDAALPAIAKSAEILDRPRLCSQPLQRGTQSLF